MTVAEKLTIELERRKAWRGGMRRLKLTTAIRCLDHGHVRCDVECIDERCLTWHVEGNACAWSKVPDESWVVDLDDDTTTGALWWLLVDACNDTKHSPVMDEERVAVLSDEDGMPPYAVAAVFEREFAEHGCGGAIAQALLMVWGG